MIRQSTLTSKQHDLSRCILSRELKLRELYIATGIYHTITRSHDNDTQEAAKHWSDGESLFLEANNITEGRFFDLSTLPPFHGKISSQEILRSNPKPKTIRKVATGEGTSGDVAALGYRDATNKEENVSSPLADATNILASGIAIIPPAGKSFLPSDENTSKDGRADLPVDQGESAAGAGLSTANEVDSTGPTAAIIGAGPPFPSSSAVEPKENPTESGFVGAGDASNTANGANPFDSLPLTSDVTGSMPESKLAAFASHQKPLDPKITESPFKQTQEAQLAQGSPQERSDVKIKEFASEVHHGVEVQSEDLNNLPEQSRKNGGQLQTRSSVTEQGAAQGAFIDNVSASEATNFVQSSAQPLGLTPFRDPIDDCSRPKLQLGTNRLQPAFRSTPATPDEQLRLEEAQSMEKAELSLTSGDVARHDQDQPSRGSPPNTSSDFVHKNMDGEESHLNAHTSVPENSLGHRSTLPGAFIRDENDQQAIKPVAALRERAFPGMVGDSSKDLTLSRRPPMRIDTGVSSISEPPKPLPAKKTVTPSGGHPFTPLSSSSHNRSSSTVQANSPPERMTTRVSSGARRHKSVSEILGETPKAAPSGKDKDFFDRGHSGVREDASIHSPQIPLSMMSPDSATFKLRLNDLKGKEKTKLSSVVFARTQPHNGLRHLESSHQQASASNDVHLQPKEYLQPLFAMQASAIAYSRRLHSLISSAHKSLSSSNHYTNFHEQQDYRILERISQLQTSNGWSFRQPLRSDEPERPASHRDVLLSHAKWMATDYKEERKWKIVAAKSIADSCAQWVNCSAEERKSLEIKVRSVSTKPDAQQHSNPAPDLIPSGEDDSSVGTDVVTPYREVSYGSAPSAIFSVDPGIFYFGAHKSAVTQKLLLELPLYQSAVQFKDTVLSMSDETPDSSWRRPIIPVSKFVEGKMVSHDQGPPRKRSRYDYENDYKSQGRGTSEVSLQSDTCNIPLRPEQDIVALLNPENKHIRDRIHAGHAFRPPSEHVMPSQSFFECRHPSQWTQREDDELRKFVREYAYNWSLISSCLSSSSMYSSGAERRTPWECFERWISLEGLPAEMSKTQYFRAYYSRLQGAQKTHEAQQQALQHNQGSNTPHLPMRRRTTQPYLVDQRKNDKHLRMLEAMRKLAKKRETALHKQQHVAGLAAMRKANEAVQPRAAMHTPQEFSRVKYERECKMQESAKAFRAQMLQQQKAAQAQKAAQQSNQSNGGPPAIPAGRPPIPNGNGSIPSIHSSLSNGHPQSSQVNQPRPIAPPRPVNVAQPNGLHVAPVNPHAIPHAPIQSHPMQQRMQPQLGSDNVRIYHEATRVQAEQQRYLLHQRQQQLSHTNGQATSAASPNMGNPKPMAQNNPAMHTSLHGRSGSPSAAVGGPAPTGSSSSPRMTTANQAQSLSSGLVPAVNEISNQIKTLHPNASPEQLKKMTTDALMKFRNNHAAQAAMHAAAGSNASMMGSNMNLTNLSTPPLPAQSPMMNGINRSPPLYNPQQQYSQILRNQQSSQQSRNTAAPGMGGPRPGSRCGTPQMHQSGSLQGGTAPAQSPRPGPAHLAGPQ